MNKKIKKPRVLWLSRDGGRNSNMVDLRNGDPFANKEGFVTWHSYYLFSFCAAIFCRYFPIGLRPGQKKKVKITIEVLE